MKHRTKLIAGLLPALVLGSANAWGGMTFSGDVFVIDSTLENFGTDLVNGLGETLEAPKDIEVDGELYGATLGVNGLWKWNVELTASYREGDFSGAIPLTSPTENFENSLEMDRSEIELKAYIKPESWTFFYAGFSYQYIEQDWTETLPDEKTWTATGTAVRTYEDSLHNYMVEGALFTELMKTNTKFSLFPRAVFAIGLAKFGEEGTTNENIDLDDWYTTYRVDVTLTLDYKIGEKNTLYVEGGYRYASIWDSEDVSGITYDGPYFRVGMRW